MIEVRVRARQAWRVAATYTAKAPGTHIYLLVLFVTTLTLRSVDATLADQLLRQLSTNLYQMGRSAGRVLVISAFLLDGGRWINQLVRLSAVYVPLERWAGTWRWLAVVVAGHVGATLVTPIGIWTDLRHDPGGGALSST